jgi:serine O-acetyltransferase
MDCKSNGREDPLPSPSRDRLVARIREDWVTHERSWSAPGFQALAMHRLGTWRRQPGIPRPLRLASGALCRALFIFIRNVYGIELHQSTRVGRRVTISHQGNVVIHPRSTIGDDCVIRQNVTIGGARHDRAGDEAPTLGRGVQVGAGAVIVGRITIGDGVRIGPNTVVMMSVPAGATVVAAPARVVMPPGSARARPEAAVAAGGRDSAKGETVA